VVTLIDRASGFNLLGDLPEDHGSESVLACLVELFDRVPEELRRTLTWDQGREMARWRDLAQLTGIDVYFAEPHSSPLSGPSNEAFNGLPRRWLPKSSDLSIYDQDHLGSISHQINTMPRRSLQWETAQFTSVDPLVALTDQPYSYAGNDPISTSDPTGLCGCSVTAVLSQSRVIRHSRG